MCLGCSILKRLIQRHVECLGWFFSSPVRWLFEWILGKKRLVILYKLGGEGLGDTLAITTILNALHRKEGVRGIVYSKFPALFENNPQVVLNLDYRSMPRLLRSILKSTFKYLRGERVICVGSEEWTLGTLPWRRNSGRHDYRRFYFGGLLPDIVDDLDHLRKALPFIVFSKAERWQYDERFRHLPEKFGVVKASVGASRKRLALAKNWSIEGMQAVVRARDVLPFSWVQLGDEAEPTLDGAINLLGRTSLRETLYILSRAQVVLTVEGFISHAAAALGRPLVIVFSGYHNPGSFYYGPAKIITAASMPACAPCYQNECTTPGKPCTSNISVQQVINACREVLDVNIK